MQNNNKPGGASLKKTGRKEFVELDTLGQLGFLELMLQWGMLSKFIGNRYLFLIYRTQYCFFS
jgi:hypothetical protein